MMRVCAAIIALLLGTHDVQAETFQGRPFRMTDARPDQTQPAPLIVAMHGFLGTPRNMRKKTRFDALAATHGFVVVYPKGKARRWNDGRLKGNPTDDVGYLGGLVENLVAQGIADPRQIYWAGHSNGGGMAMRMACERRDLVTGIAVVATKIPTDYPCADGPPVPAIFFHGTADPIAPDDGRSADSRLGTTLSGQASVQLWERRNQCAGRGKVTPVDRLDDGTAAQIIQYRGCRAALVYVRIQGQGHDWPGAGRRDTLIQGKATREVDASALSWWFFSGL